MRDESVQPGTANLGRLVRIFALTAVIFVVVLAFAPVRPYFAEWRRVQHQYNELATSAGTAPIAIQIRQIWRPALGVTDRCITCHLGMGVATPLSSKPLFAAHPPVPHEPAEFGCTVCHGGQGRATRTDAAHGFVSHWDEQILDRDYLSAGCGTCHDQFPAAPRTMLRRGLHLVESLDCLSCHKLDGRGRGDGPDLTYVGLSGYRRDFHADHLKRHAQRETEAWRTSYGDISAEDLATIQTYLDTRVGAGRMVEAQALALERGCLGCHKIDGRGGDEGPALDAVGRKPVGDLDVARVEGAKTLANYLRQHLIDPPGVTAGSLMPAQVYTPDEVELLTSWTLFLRSRELPANFLPKDRVRREVLGAEPAPLAGSQVFQAFCSGCHGPEGQGRNYANLDVRFPSIGLADFLNVASDTFIEQTLTTGRPGRRMPPLAGPAGTLKSEEVSGLLRYLRSLAPAPPSYADVERAPGDLAAGAERYRNECAACHGADGEGTVLGSPLATADGARRNRRAAYDALVGGVSKTAMPAYTAHDAAAVRSLLDYMASLPVVAGSRESWRLGAGEAARGAAVYARVCAGCHGPAGEGGLGPALGNTGFQQAATPTFVAITVVRGRAGTPMPAFGRDHVSYPRLAAQEVLDVAAFVTGGLTRP